MNRILVFAGLLAAIAAAATPLPAGAVGTAPFMAEPSHGYVMPVRTMKEIRLQSAFRTTVHQQYDFSCGSAAVATLLTHHYNRPVNEAQVFQAMWARGDQAKIRAEGFSLLDMKRYLEGEGYRADGVKVSLEELAKVGVPGIALISDNGYKHFVVVKGMQGSRVILGDPSLGTRILPREQFDSLWVGGIFFVIRSHLNIARFNAEADWNSRLSAPIAQSVVRNSLGALTLGIPDSSRF